MLAGPLGAAGGGAAEGGVAVHTLATAALQPAGGGAATTWTCDHSHSLQSAGLWIDNQWKKQEAAEYDDDPTHTMQIIMNDEFFNCVT